MGYAIAIVDGLLPTIAIAMENDFASSKLGREAIELGRTAVAQVLRRKHEEKHQTDAPARRREPAERSEGLHHARGRVWRE